MTGFARIIQLSDFHFGPKLTHEKRAFYKRPFLWAKAKPHSFSKLVSLARKVEDIERHKGTFDVVLGTGDLATDGSSEAFRLCRDYIQAKDIRGGVPSRPLIRCLDVNPQRCILTPGNHDRFDRSWVGFQNHGARFEQILGAPTTYPYVVGYRKPESLNIPDEPAVLFFVFDSTPSVFASLWPWNRIARGRLEPGECDSFFQEADERAQTGRVRATNGTKLNIRYSNCVRVAVLHHHPLDAGRTTLMENNSEFIDYCFRAGIHLVLFGHDHHEFWLTRFGQARLPQPDPYHKMTFYCCPSASEYASENGFYTFEFDKTGVLFSFYKWNDRMKAFEVGGLDETNRFLPDALQKIHFSQPLR